MNNHKKKICPRCNYSGRDGDVSCPYCGLNLISGCPTCGAPIRVVFAKYCYGCGTPLSVEPGSRAHPERSDD